MNLGHKLREIAEKDPRYLVEAYEFLFRALDFTMEELNRRDLPDEDSRHISAKELLFGIQRYSVQQFGYLARSVFNHWGVHTTDDFGEIVFNLVENDLLKKRPEDSREEFAAVYDFEDALDGPALDEVKWAQESKD